jgi:hypothetical protein
VAFQRAALDADVELLVGLAEVQAEALLGADDRPATGADGDLAPLAQQPVGSGDAEMDVVVVDRLVELGVQRHPAVADPDQRQVTDRGRGEAPVERPAAAMALETVRRERTGDTGPQLVEVGRGDDLVAIEDHPGPMMAHRG